VSKTRVLLKGKERRCKRFFLDSGAHSLYTLHVIEEGHKNGYKWYKSKEFIRYVDSYAKFLKENKDGIDFYANVDIIFNPKMTWQVQKYMEDKHGLSPVPLIHYGTPMEWVDKYVEAGYSLLGVGGLGQEVTMRAYINWGDRLFERLCQSPSRLPRVRTHGFAMTSFPLMARWPWWSVDSASWAKLAGYGSIYVPHRRNGKWDFGLQPYMIAFSHRLQPSEKRIVFDWLDYVNVPFGSRKEGTTERYGVISEYNARAVANARFFQKLAEWLPKYPWPFTLKPQTGFVKWEDVR
jgi:hypothetical protein